MKSIVTSILLASAVFGQSEGAKMGLGVAEPARLGDTVAIAADARAAEAGAANIAQYEDRSAFVADTSSRTLIDFDTLRNACIAIPDSGGVTVNGVNFNGGVSRATTSGPCSPPVAAFQNYALTTRLVIRADAPAQAFTTATLPAGVTAVGFEVGINSDPVTSRILVTLVTSDNSEQTVTVSGKGTGAGGSRRITPVFVGLISNRPIAAVRFRTPDITDSNLILDNFIIGQTAAPSIKTSNGVVNGASFQSEIAPNTWITIFGRLLSGSSRPWAASDFSASHLPTSLEDVSVMINGKPAYVYYVSPGQLNVLTPANLSMGPAIFEVSRGGVKSAPVTVQTQPIAPALFRFDAENSRYAAATHTNGTLVGKTSLYPGATMPARPGEIITLWGAGFGRTTPDIPEGELVYAPSRLTATPVVTIGAVTSDVLFAGLTGPGLYQINVRVPETAPDGDLTVGVQLDGARSPDNVFITVQH